jgi:hypothetical protein
MADIWLDGRARPKSRLAARLTVVAAIASGAARL